MIEIAKRQSGGRTNDYRTNSSKELSQRNRIF
jgi:hypothetical protein